MGCLQYFSFQLLSNTLPQNWATETKPFVTLKFYESCVWEWWHRCCQEILGKSHSCRYLKTWLGWWVSFQKGPLTWLCWGAVVPHQLWAWRGLSTLPSGVCPSRCLMPPQHTSKWSLRAWRGPQYLVIFSESLTKCAPHSEERDMNFYLWQRGLSKNLWTYFKTTIPRVLALSKILRPTSDLARGRAQGPGVCIDTHDSDVGSLKPTLRNVLFCQTDHLVFLK